MTKDCPPTSPNVFSPPNKTEAERLVERAKSTPLSDGGLQTSALLSRALCLDPHNHDSHILQERLHQTFVPRWHFPMLADSLRNRAYAKAIAATVTPDDVVLDIGCGAGLTAMLAARAGAKHVYTCEQQPLIAQAARQVIADNGLSDKITVIPKWSHDIIIGEDMPEQADVVLSEIVDTVLLGEGALATLIHAMSALAKPEARAIPESGALRAQLVESDALLSLWRPQEAEGFDLSAFHRFVAVAQLTPSDFEAYNMKALGPSTDLFHFDFKRPSLSPARVTTDLTCSTPGRAHAVLASFQLQLAPGVVLDNGLNGGGHWGRTAFLLDQPETTKPCDRLRITAQHDAAHLSLSVHGKLPALEETCTPGVWLSPAWMKQRPQQASVGQRASDAPAWRRSEAATGQSLENIPH